MKVEKLSLFTHLLTPIRSTTLRHANATPSQNKTENYEMPKQTFTVGRATKNDLVVSRYSSISRKHIEMDVSDSESAMTVLGAAGTQLFMNRTSRLSRPLHTTLVVLFLRP